MIGCCRRLFARAAHGLPLARLPDPRVRESRPSSRENHAERAGQRARAAVLREFRVVNAEPRRRPGSDVRRPLRGDARSDIVSHTLKRITDSSPLDRAIAEARDALIARQDEQGYWLYELEADCTIPAEYIMMMHFLDEIDARAPGKDRQPPARRQAEHGGWPLYHGGDIDLSCTVKAYYALKLAGDDIRRAAHGSERAPRFCSAAAPRGPMFSRA